MIYRTYCLLARDVSGSGSLSVCMRSTPPVVQLFPEAATIETGEQHPPEIAPEPFRCAIPDCSRLPSNHLFVLEELEVFRICRIGDHGVRILHGLTLAPLHWMEWVLLRKLGG